MAARFRMKRKGVGEMLRMPGMEAEMLRRAEVIKGVAIGLSPVDENGPHPGHYKASWETSSTRRGGRKRDRAVGYVRNTAYYARWVEYGTEKVHAHHVLLRAAQIGGRNQ
ncbi:HK97 gp10 family phage protein [Streptomyces sp. bgisy022]|uniref:HK97 gp10 family phage protein n=1 Tax=Streptomyces sp. bgisy022 TaxID=3413769 RepID=UPI003D707573